MENGTFLVRVIDVRRFTSSVGRPPICFLDIESYEGNSAVSAILLGSAEPMAARLLPGSYIFLEIEGWEEEKALCYVKADSNITVVSGGLRSHPRPIICTGSLS